MKTKLLSLLLISPFLLGVAASAQTTSVTVPTPAPVINDAPDAAPDVAAPNRIIYSPRLPSPTELSNVAAAQNQAIERIDQSSDQITVTYKSANGQRSTVAYQLLSNTGSQPATTTVVESRPVRRVVYASPAPYYYYDEPYIYPWGYGYYNPVSLSLGFGYYRGFGGGYYGGYRGHYGGRGGYRRR